MSAQYLLIQFLKIDQLNLSERGLKADKDDLDFALRFLKVLSYLDIRIYSRLEFDIHVLILINSP